LPDVNDAFNNIGNAEVQLFPTAIEAEHAKVGRLDYENVIMAFTGRVRQQPNRPMKSMPGVIRPAGRIGRTAGHAAVPVRRQHRGGRLRLFCTLVRSTPFITALQVQCAAHRGLPEPARAT